jgi:hypothetical protein
MKLEELKVGDFVLHRLSWSNGMIIVGLDAEKVSGRYFNQNNGHYEIDSFWPYELVLPRESEMR